MRWFEWLLVGWGLAGAAGSFARPRGHAWSWIFCAVAAALLALHAWREGAHWQMLPLYAGLAVIGLSLARESSISFTVVGISLIGCTLALSWALPMFRLPPPTGVYGVGTRTLFLEDQARHRELVTQVWYPALASESRARYAKAAERNRLSRYQAQIRTNSYQDAAMAGDAERFPVVIFGHKWGGARTQDTFLMEELASQGYVVASVDHPGNAARVQLSQGRVQRSTMEDGINTARGTAAVLAAWNAELEVWATDDRFVLNALAEVSESAGSWAYERLDLSRVGAVGHSFGGAASMRLLGLDPRVKCAVNLDGWTFGGLDQRTDQPVLFLYEAPPAALNPHPEARPMGPSSEDELERLDRDIVDASLQRSRGYKAFVQGTQHDDFTDRTLYSPLQRLTYTGPIAGTRIREITRAVVLGFLDRTLKGTGTMPDYPELYWPSRGARIKSVEVAAGSSRD